MSKQSELHLANLLSSLKQMSLSMAFALLYEFDDFYPICHYITKDGKITNYAIDLGVDLIDTKEFLKILYSNIKADIFLKPNLLAIVVCMSIIYTDENKIKNENALRLSFWGKDGILFDNIITYSVNGKVYNYDQDFLMGGTFLDV